MLKIRELQRITRQGKTAKTAWWSASHGEIESIQQEDTGTGVHMAGLGNLVDDE